MQSELNTISNKLTNWWDVLVQNIPNIIIAIGVLFVTYMVSKYTFKLAFKFSSKKVQQIAVAKLISRAFSIVVVLGGLILSLSALNLSGTVTGLLSAAGVSGLVIGLALQGTLSNTISGIVLSFRKNISLGDWIETNGYSGEVVDINMNYFVLKEADNNIVVLPNKSIIENPFKNYTLTSKMRVVIESGVSYDSDLDQVKEIVKSVIQNLYNQDGINDDFEFFYTGFGDSSINFVVRFWIYGENGLAKLHAKSKAIIAIKKAFDKHSIEIPFPIRTLQFSSDTGIAPHSLQEQFSNN